MKYLICILLVSLMGCTKEKKPCQCKDLPDRTRQEHQDKVFCYISDTFNEDNCGE